MIGALSIHNGLVHTEAFAGTNTVDSFLPFLQRLKEKCKARPTIVVMDNLSVHHSKAIKFQFDNHQFIAKYLPPQSCALNPIEQVWNVIKGQWKRTSYMVMDVSKKKEEQIIAAVNQIQGIADTIDQDMMRRMARGNYDAMWKTLQGWVPGVTNIEIF